MCTTSEKLDAKLSHLEFRIITSLCELAQNNEVQIEQKQLAALCATSTESIRRALRNLEIAGLLTTTRQRRNLGKLYKNMYTLCAPSHAQPSHTDEGYSDSPSHTHVGSTAVLADSTVVLQSVTDTTNKLDNTSYYLGGDRGSPLERKKTILVNTWNDDDDIAGFGLLEGELPASKKQPKASKRNPKTRHQRPQEDWTAMDVASEFSSRVYQTLPGLPIPVNTKKVWGALARMRKTSNSNAVIELEVLDMFFADPWLKASGMEYPQHIVGKFLKMMSTHFQQALRNLDLPELEPVSQTEDYSQTDEFVYASDGTEFDNSMYGRRMLREHEEELRVSATEA